MTAQLVSVRETVRRTVDRGLQLECHTWTIRRVQCHVWSTRGTADRVQHPAEAELVAPYLVNGGPIGDFCESLRDLVAHVLIWDEINLAVLAATRDALLGELSRYDEEASIAPIALDHARAASPAALAFGEGALSGHLECRHRRTCLNLLSAKWRVPVNNV